MGYHKQRRVNQGVQGPSHQISVMRFPQWDNWKWRKVETLIPSGVPIGTYHGIRKILSQAELRGISNFSFSSLNWHFWRKMTKRINGNIDAVEGHCRQRWVGRIGGQRWESLDLQSFMPYSDPMSEFSPCPISTLSRSENRKFRVKEWNSFLSRKRYEKPSKSNPLLVFLLFFKPRTFSREWRRRNRGMTWTQLEWE